jgi:hypothetical protein
VQHARTRQTRHACADDDHVEHSIELTKRVFVRR